MNNLVALAGVPAGLREHAAGSRIVCVAHEPLQQALFAATDDGRLVGVGLDAGDLVLEAPVTAGAVIAVHALAELDVVFVATADGALLLMHLDTEAWETVGEMEGGLLAASCSPDGELLVCLTRTLTLVALSTSSWEVLAERELEAGSVDLACQPVFAWRADGHKCTMLARNAAGKHRIAVMDRGCATEFESDTLDGVGQALAFHPDGSLIAASQKIANRHDIIFFEPNALRHYELTLPPERTAATVEGLSWSADGALLAVSLSGAGGDAVQVWHRGNYHWYLKYEYVAAPPSDTAAPAPWARSSCLWHESDPLSALLFVGSDDARVFTFTWEWMVSSPYLRPADSGGEGKGKEGKEGKGKDWSTVASIDGKRLLLTPLRKMIVPPPMSAATLEVSSPIVAAAWGPGGRVAVLCSDFSLHLCSCPFEDEVWDKPPVVEATVKVAGRLFQLAWPARDVLVSLSVQGQGRGTVVALPLLLSPPNSATPMQLLPHARGLELKTSAAKAGLVRLTREVGQGGSVVQVADGSILALATARAPGSQGAHQQLLLQPAAALPEPCVVVAALPDARGWVGLSKRGKLWWGTVVLAEGVTSLALHGRLLLVTTAALRLQAYQIDNGPGTSAPSLLCDDGRMLERGAVLVAAPDEDQRVIMSMPRGNLEVMHPQLLVVRRAAALLAARDYLRALSLMRKHKVDMNLLVDFDPAAFFADTAPAPPTNEAASAGTAPTSFLLSSLGKQAAHLLSLFIASLRNESVRESLYPFTPLPPSNAISHDWAALAASSLPAGAKATGPEAPVSLSKVNGVCDLMHRALAARSDPALRACMVLTFVRRHPPRVEEALRHLQGVDQDETAEGLEVLMGLIDGNEVWEAALGIYDLSLAAHVARLSGKDPREYAPLLEQLATKGDRECCFEIDMMLKRFDKAVMHAVRGGEGMWKKARAVMEDHALYLVAVHNLRRMAGRGAHLQEALQLYADHVSQRGEHRLAGLVYKTAGLTSQATAELQQDTISWEAALLLLHEQGQHGDAELQGCCYGIAQALRVGGDCRGAARVYLDYCADVDEAVAALAEGREWVEAARVARRGKRADLLPTTVVPSLEEAEAAAGLDFEDRLSRSALLLRPQSLMSSFPASLPPCLPPSLPPVSKLFCSLMSAPYTLPPSARVVHHVVITGPRC